MRWAGALGSLVSGVPTVVLRLRKALALAVESAPLTVGLYVCVTVVSGAVPVAITWLTKSLVDHLVAGSPAGAIARLAVGLGLAGMVATTLPALGELCGKELRRAVSLQAQDRLFASLERNIGLRRFEDPSFLDQLRLAQQAGGTTSSLAVDGVLGIVRALLTIGGFVGILWLLGPLFSVLAICSGVPLLIVEVVLSRRRVGLFQRMSPAERRELFYGELLSSVEAAKEVRIFGIGPFLRARVYAERRATNAAHRDFERKEVAIQLGLSLFASVISVTGVLWVATGAAGNTGMSVGDVLMLVGALAGIQGAMVALAAEIAQSSQALFMFKHYLATVEAGPELPKAASPARLPALRQGIELRDVWFRYSDEHPWILRGVDLRIPYGETVALVGLNGSGKSTIVKLLCRFYDPSRGAILWDGVDLRDVDPEALRRRVTVLFQDYMHYDMTAEENIALGDLDARRQPARIEAAAVRARIHDKIVSLPRGYESLLTRAFYHEPEGEHPEEGVLLSEGQWQRLALARTFVREGRDLLILDEPSSGLDAESEHEIHSSLAEHRAGHAALLITHRLNAVRDAGLIVVLSDGVVVERGRHDDLVARDGGVYARLFALQASGYRTSGDGVPDIRPVVP
ncbi:ABC transporter ATP-binding protein [Nonomuraea zeae]|uniref:ABC transporter ATP-binding protein n=1 Tax=Nonomuraea zeae TaxID=1642303 RepID=A0A5S4F8C2_9ACTN|nr:ABC transporter ATP-binding protein [Nonomuraea zeae]TMR12528.1 ABC transporter ATP-binding protein [Nonomuraea zeae]